MLARLLRFRGLLLILTGRELKARYRGSFLGFFWSLVNPLLLLAVYTLVFDIVFQARWGGAEPYSVFLVTGLFPWIWLSGSLLDATGSLLENSGLIRKAVFPAEVLPVVTVLAQLVHFVLALPIAGVALVGARLFDYPVGGWSVFGLPLAMLVQLPFVAGLALALAALNVHFKDVQDLLQNLLTLGFFLTPILYPLSSIRQVPWAWAIVAANPATPYIQIYQDLLFAGVWPAVSLWLRALGTSLLAWGFGCWVFARLRNTLVEAA
ncbi:MAG: ABC transporter permease [Thermoanaerobaculia bacterium]|nr:ABC transporter permease [Thermoanaerobaculia bacterium]